MLKRLATVLAASILATGCIELPSQSAAPGEEPHIVPHTGERPRLALVLSGGSLRGFAHLGVLKVLEANGIRPDLIVGTSAGSIAGGLYASGVPAERLIEAARNVQFDLGSAFLSGGKSPVHEFVAANLAETQIERFPIRYAAVAADIRRGCVASFNGGDAAVAIQASAAVPGVFAPTKIGASEYADGGLASPLPVLSARALGAEKVIAVNITFDPRESKLGSVLDRLFQTALVMTRTLALDEAREADLVIDPVLPPESEITLANRNAIIAAGERAALEALPRIRALLAAERPSERIVADPRACQQPT